MSKQIQNHMGQSGYDVLSFSLTLFQKAWNGSNYTHACVLLCQHYISIIPEGTKKTHNFSSEEHQRTTRHNAYRISKNVSIFLVKFKTKYNQTIILRFSQNPYFTSLFQEAKRKIQISLYELTCAFVGNSFLFCWNRQFCNRSFLFSSPH